MARTTLFAFMGSLALLLPFAGLGQNVNYHSSDKLSPSDYLWGYHGKLRDPVFDNYRTIDLGVDLGVDSDCGRINFRNTLKGALQNVLDTKYLGDMGKDLMAASPMLLTCYVSPTWCSILKHSRVRANFLAQLRLSQCRAIDRYTDMRVADAKEERARCNQRAIERHDGNMEAALEECQGPLRSDWGDWSGAGKDSSENRLIESTAKWIFPKGEAASRVVSLTKALLGDTIVKRGSISVDFGPDHVPLSPSKHLRSLKQKTYQTLCGDVLGKLMAKGGYKANVYQVVTDGDLVKINGKKSLVDRQTLLSLSYLPFQKRELACKKLAAAISMTLFSQDMTQVLDFASIIPTNPNLPSRRVQESSQKRKAFKDQVELTLALEKTNSKPLNEVLYSINSEGEKFQQKIIQEEFDVDNASRKSRNIERLFFDCGDGIGCID